MRNMLLARYPLLARSPSALHDMAVRLFVNSVASNVAAQNSFASAQAGVLPPPASSSATASTNVAHNFSGTSLSTTANSNDTLPLVVDVDNESSNDAS